ncbi:uncharacterized protein LOC107363733 [Tetranychus urticae]|uniref:Uncharacterized protein n=1 Tax=Tetranychus urticae TaxID=32264 RepID=T1KEQ2_TETUR|nr:uncharacterized protein LOC107363733 [Tetranychus urticae]XP_025016907.1 uncharacterized protein LOC107363733 [Tetranychus urticae]XP_025016908.1 uncharacterized protein LOC107363733 [Tetranychus urticae]XP_025016909.1 uncharacterized protein LOC107363733 [Tetranychus urticae]
MLINQTPLVFSILLPSIFPVLTIVYTEIKPGQYPYLMFFDASIVLSGVNVTGVGVLVSDRTIVTDAITGMAVKAKPTFAYSGYSGKSNNTNLSLRYSIQDVVGSDNNPAYDLERRPYVLNNSFTVVILKDAVKFEDGLHPIIIPYYTSADETELVHIGLSMATGNLYHTKIQMKKWGVCIRNYESVNHLAPPRYFFPPSGRTMVCTSVMPTVEKSMPPDSIVQGPFIIKGLTPKDDRLVGIHSFFYYLRNQTRIAVGPDLVLLREDIIFISKGTLSFT